MSRYALIIIAALLAACSSDAAMRRFTPAAVDSIRVIGVNVNTINGVRHVNVSNEGHSPPNRWSVANVATFDSAQTWFVEGVTAKTIAHPLEEDVRFTLAGKTFRHYLWLPISVLCVATSIGMALFIGTRRGMPKRFGWAALSLVGLGMFSINWNTGASVTNLYSVQIGGASLSRGAPVMPWILVFDTDRRLLCVAAISPMANPIE